MFGEIRQTLVRSLFTAIDIYLGDLITDQTDDVSAFAEAAQ